MSSGAESRFGIHLGDVVTVGVAGYVGAAVAGLVFQVGNPEILRVTGAIIGAGSPVGRWVTIIGLGVVLAVPFLRFSALSIDPFVRRIIAITSRIPALRKAVVSLLRISALGVTLFALGLLYGFASGLAVFGLAVPELSKTVIGPFQTLQYFDPVALLGWTIYGGVTGLVYGVVQENTG